MNVPVKQFKERVARAALVLSAAGLLGGCAAYDPYYGDDGVYYGKSHSHGGYYGGGYHDGYRDYGYPGRSRYSSYSSYNYYGYGYYPRYYYRGSRDHHDDHDDHRYPDTYRRDRDHHRDGRAIDEVRRIETPQGRRAPRDSQTRWPAVPRREKARDNDQMSRDGVRRAVPRSGTEPRAASEVTRSRTGASRPSRPRTGGRRDSGSGIGSPLKDDSRR